MTAAELERCPDWPAAMCPRAAALYAGGPAMLARLVDEGLLEPIARGNRLTRYLRADLDTALYVARERGVFRRPPPAGDNT